MTTRTGAVLGALITLALLVAGCGSAKTKTDTATTASAASTNTTLRIPYLADMSVPDPDVFYDIEGNSVILNSYDGLVRYAPSSTKIVPVLAKSWTISPDRLTYTFKLRPGVTFHDGTPMTSKSVKASFERRLDVGQAPSYMIKPIASMTTPDDTTFVVKLKHPVDPFMAYLASSWGPKVIGPKAIVDNAGKDFGQTYLKTHDDGTGPFMLTSFKRGQQYTMTRDPKYWGPAPFFKQILFKITPDIGTQRLELQNGDLDAVLHSFPASELSSLPSNLKVVKVPSFLKLLLYVNTHRAPFSSAAVRSGLGSTVDVDQLVSQAYSGTATQSTGVYPPGILPGQASLPYAPDPTKAKAAADRATTKKITLAYTSDESGVLRRASELVQAQLAAAGYDVTLKEVQLPQVYGYISNLKSAPDLLLTTNTPDAANPDTWARILFYSTGGLNFFGYSDKSIDALLDKAVSAPSATANPLYNQAGQKLIDSNAILFLGDVKNVFVLDKNLTNVQQIPAYPWTVTLATLKRSAG